MTLIVYMPAKDGAIVASDGQATTGKGIKIPYKKIYKLNENCIWGMSGEVVLQERVEERIDVLTDKEKPLKDLCPILRDSITKCVEELSASIPPHLPYEGEFLFIEYRDRPRILYIHSTGFSRWCSNKVPFAIGSGTPFALALLRKYQVLEKLDLQLAAVLAYKIIAETIEVTEGVGYPIDIWQLPPVKNFIKEELNALQEVYIGLKESEIKLFFEKIKK